MSGEEEKFSLSAFLAAIWTHFFLSHRNQQQSSPPAYAGMQSR